MLLIILVRIGQHFEVSKKPKFNISNRFDEGGVIFSLTLNRNGDIHKNIDFKTGMLT